MHLAASIITQTIGGLGLFILGMKMMTEGLQMVSGKRIRIILNAVSSNRVLGCLTGAGITAMVQSSSATTVMLIGFVGAGLMTLQQAVSMVLGANIGTTVTAQLIAFTLTQAALPAIALGVGLKFFARQRKYRHFGEVILGFGLLFFGMLVMTQGLAPIKKDPAFIAFFTRFDSLTLSGLLLSVFTGAMLTIIVQSSSATVGLTMALATQGLLTFPGAMALVLGENIGTTITAELATIGSSDVNAHRAARAHTMFNVIGVGIMLLVFPYFVDLVTVITGWMGTGPVGQVANGETVNVARYIANGHTLFNLINAGIFLLFLPWLIKIATALSPKREEPEDLFQLPKFDNRFVDSPIAALAQTRNEIVRMSETAMITLENTVNCILERDPKKLSKWKRYEEHLDVMQKEIIAFLTSIYQGDVSADVAGEISNLMRITNNIERVGDAVENLAKRTEDLIENNIPFTPEAQADVKKIATQVMGFLNLVNEGLQTDTPRLFQKAELLENIIDQLREEMRHAHIVRLRQGECSIDPGLIFLDLLANLERIGDFCFSCVKAMVEIGEGARRTAAAPTATWPPKARVPVSRATQPRTAPRGPGL